MALVSYIPYGKITILQGDPGCGKTMAVLSLAALLSKGESLPFEEAVREPINILYQTSEDGIADTIKPRLESAGANCTRIKIINEENNLSHEHLAKGSIHAPRVKPDVIHLYLEKSM